MSYLHLIQKIPKEVSIAVSGGVDSMVCLDFLLRGNKKVTALHFNHGTDNADEYERFIRKYCDEKGVTLKVGSLKESIPKGRSSEDFWREKRYEFFKENHCGDLITCHHLDDAVETWVFSSLKGNSKLIPYKRDYVIRPFLLNKKAAFYSWALKHKVPYIEDQTNFESHHDRNYIRNKMMKDVLHINPGIHKTIKKKLMRAASI